MKMKYKMFAAIGAACLSLTSAQALTVGNTSPYVVGEVVFNGNYTAPQGGQLDRDLIMINQLVNIANNNAVQAAPYYLNATIAKPAGLPLATLTGAIGTAQSGMSFGGSGIGAVVNITLNSTFKYLIAAYDGPNGGATVWDISSFAAGTALTVPRYAQPNANGTQMVVDAGTYQITTWSVYNPGTPSVPDGGSTALLLGAALSGVGLLRRKLA